MFNSLDPKMQQDHHSVAPDLGPNCLQSLSADDKVEANFSLYTPLMPLRVQNFSTITPNYFLSPDEVGGI